VISCEPPGPLAPRAGDTSQNRYLFDHRDEFSQRLGSRETILFLDFDGTLAPIADTPERASAPATVLYALGRLAEAATLAVVSGRSLSDLRERVGIDGIAYAGNHGAEILAGNGVIRAPGMESAAQSLPRLLERLRAGLAGIPGVLIEDKGITASVHYRLADPSREADVLRIIRDRARDFSRDFRITTGKKVCEVRPHAAWHKGHAVARIMELRGRGMVPVYVGDDTTDEDAFRAIRGSGISVSVGENPEADYFLREQAEIAQFLEWMNGILSRRARTANEKAQRPHPATGQYDP
jgi:trehalose-phosphatase